MDFEEGNLDDYLPVCADCGASRPEWASINRGILICSECCHVHRNLGRHISQIKSLKTGVWHSNQLNLMTVLYRSGSNNIWEHSLIDISSQNVIRSKKKPVSNDPIIPKKETFIKAKYIQLAYAIRPSKDDSIKIDDLNKQLWSCVRTAHVETTLRLLALGADPNYADAESGNTPLHVAGKEGQKLQVELLWIYGGDPGQKNVNGKLPTELANEENYTELALRLIELEFDVSDRFSMFLCGRKAEHANNQHFLIPDLAGPISENIRKFRKLLQNSSSVQLERLIQDVYDEVDRREINLQWQAAEQFRISNQHVAVFLPPNYKLSATRNQLRQKLAKFDARDFSQLIIDLLKEIRRRYFCHPLPPTDEERIAEIQMALDQSTNRISNLDDSRDYDEVACSELGRYQNRKSRESSNTRISSANKIIDFDGETTDPLLMNPSIALDNYLELKEKFNETTDKLNAVVNTNLQMFKEFQSIKKCVERIQNEQTILWDQIKLMNQNGNEYSSSNSIKKIISPLTVRSPTGSIPNPTTINADIGAVIMPTSSLINKQQIDNNTHRSLSHPNTINRLSKTTLRHDSLTLSTQRLFEHFNNQGVVNSRLFNLDYSTNILNEEACRNGSAPPPLASNQCFNEDDGVLSELLPNNNSSNSGLKALFNDEVFPDNLIIETELLTGAIKNLLSDLQQSGLNDSNSTFHADQINHHISRIVRVIPLSSMVGIIHLCVSEMKSAMTELSKKCHQRPLNTDETCHAAYDLAKAAKQLLVTVHSRQDFI